jgi:hypothetical protein
MKKMMRERMILIPKRIKEKIDQLEVTRIQKIKAYRLCELILNKQQRDDHDYESFTELPQAYLRKVFGGGNYHRFLDKLKPDIIEVAVRIGVAGEYIESYSNCEGNGQSKRYRVCPDLMTCDFVAVKCDGAVTKGDSQKLWLGGECFDISIVTDDIVALKYDRTILVQAMEEHLTDIHLPTNDQIKKSVFEVRDTGNGYIYFSKLDNCLRRTKNTALSLIQDGRKYIVGDHDSYLKKKKSNVLFSYTRSIEMLFNKGCHYAKRCKGNNRLDHNLTGISKKLLAVIMKENDLCEIDMANSQFALLAWLMERDQNFICTPDHKVFAKQAATGHLYEYIETALKLSSRQEAKVMMMELSFSSYRNSSANKSKLRQLFPSIVGYCDDYKKMNGDNALAIWLQKEEAAIFVDKIYFRLKKQGFWVLTRHDSLLIKAPDKEHIKTFVNKIFNTIDFKCSLK